MYWALVIRLCVIAAKNSPSVITPSIHFVRWTTRVAARAVGYSHDRELRNHYLNHLKGEINHEIIIEQDLTYLGHDIDYLMKRSVPTSPTFKFMVVQESAVSFHHDPVLLAGSPLAAEGLTSHLPASLIDNLRECIASWGYTAPGNGMRFLTSHILTDGGDDGHWQEAIQAVVQNLSDEGRFQQILVMTRTSMAALSVVPVAPSRLMLLAQRHWGFDCSIISLRISIRVAGTGRGFVVR